MVYIVITPVAKQKSEPSRQNIDRRTNLNKIPTTPNKNRHEIYKHEKNKHYIIPLLRRDAFPPPFPLSRLISITFRS